MTTAEQPRASKKRQDGGQARAVHDALLEAITRQRLPPGTRLHEESLAEIFRVSRTQIRAALQRLGLRGLVTSEYNRSARVASPSVEEVRELFAVRRWLEPQMAAEAAARMSKAELAALRQHLDREHAAREAGDRIEATRLSGQFHVLLASCTGNRIAQGMVEELVNRSFLVTFLYQRPGSLGCVNEEHEQLLQDLESGIADKAAASMRQHIDRIEGRMVLDGKDEDAIDLRLALQGLLPP